MIKRGITVKVTTVAILFFLFLMCSDMLFAKTKDSFISLGTGARALGMGSAFCGIADDANAIYWNAAGLSLLNKPEVAGIHISLWEETLYDSLNVAYPVDNIGTFGLGITRIAISDIEKRQSPLDAVSTFKDTQMGFFAAYSKNIFDKIYCGIMLKEVSHEIDVYRDQGFGMDLGLLWHFLDVFSMGINIQNILPPSLTLKQTEEEYLLNTKVGIAYNLYNVLPGQKDKLIIAADFDNSRADGLEQHYGIEYWFKNLVAFRFGYDKDYFVGGLGVKYRNYFCDYAFLPHELGLSHRFSFTARFGYNRKEKERILKEEKERREKTAKTKERISTEASQKEGQIETEALFQKGMGLVEQGDLLEAALVLEKCLWLNPEDEEIKKFFEDVSDKLDKEIVSEGQDSMIFQTVKESYVKGINEYKKYNFEKAILEFDKVLKQTFHPKTKKYLEQAAKHLALREGREDAELYLKKAEKSVQNSQYVEAKTYLEKSLNLYPEYLPAKKLLTQIGFKIKTEAEIKKYLKSGEKHFDKGKYEEAMIDFYHVLKVNPDDKEVIPMLKKSGLKIIGKNKTDELSDKEQDDYLKKGNDFCEKRDYKKGIYYWANIIISNPANMGVLEKIERAYRDLQTEKKTEKKRSFSEEREKEKKEKIDKYSKEAEEFYKSGKYNNSIESWRKVLEIDAENKAAKEGINESGEKLEKGKSEGVNLQVVEEYYKQGLIYYHQGNYQEAIIEWKKVLELVPGHEKAKANIKAVEEKMISHTRDER